MAHDDIRKIRKFKKVSLILLDYAFHYCGLGRDVVGSRASLVQFNSHLFLSPIGARTLKMPVPYPPPNVGACRLYPDPFSPTTPVQP